MPRNVSHFVVKFRGGSLNSERKEFCFLEKLAYERGQDHFVSNVQDKMEVLSGELQKTKRAKQEIIQQHAELQNNFLNATLKVQELESENKALRDLMKVNNMFFKHF